MITHAEATNKKWGKNQPLCMQWARARKFATVSADPSKVSCTRCAKQLGVKPAAKVESGSPTGTCQCCFGTFKAPKSVTLSLHGYERPGNGYIVGRCRGEGHVPFEVSCEQTKIWLQELKGIRDGMKERLAKLEVNAIEELVAWVDTNERDRNYRHVKKAVVVKRGEEEKRNPFYPETDSFRYYKIPSFDALRKSTINEVKGNISQVENDITFVAGKVDSWVATPWPKKV